jgi:hypothetical protein
MQVPISKRVNGEIVVNWENKGTTGFQKQFYLYVGCGSPTGTNGAGDAVDFIGGDTPTLCVPFADAQAQSYVFNYELPPDYTQNSAVGAVIEWSGPASGNVRWNVACKAISPDATITTGNYGAAGAVTDGVTVVGSRQVTSTITNLVIAKAAGQPTAGDELYIKITRDGTHTEDTMANTANMLKVKILYS